MSMLTPSSTARTLSTLQSRNTWARLSEGTSVASNAIVEIGHIPRREIHDRFARGPPEIFSGAAQIRFRKMRVIKRDHRNSQRPAGSDRFPCDLIRIARFDDVRALALQDFLDRAQIQQRAITRSAREQRRVDRINARAPLPLIFPSFGPGTIRTCSSSGECLSMYAIFS